MKGLLIFLILVVVITLGEAYSKYGRTCKDIGCPSNQVCVMKEDPCTRHSRRNECGRYPSCKRVSNAAATCATFVCPPTTTCQMHKGSPKCYNNRATGHKQAVPVINPRGGPDISNRFSEPSYPQNPGYVPNYPPRHQTTQRPNVYYQHHNMAGGYPGGAIGSGYPGAYQSYPNYGQTTSRPNMYQPGQRVSNGGYAGGAIGSGYPGQGGYQGYQQPGYTGYQGYPSQGGGYPSQGGGYPAQRGGYPVQGGGYPTQGGSYPGQGGYYYQNSQNNYNRQGYNQASEQVTTNPLLDTLKTLGANYLRSKLSF